MKTATIIIASIIMTGCATRGANYVPVVDMQGRSSGQYNTDLSDCQGYAKHRMDAADGAVSGAIAGAIIGGIFAALITPRGYRNYAVAPVIAAGAMGGAVDANDTQETIIKRCLAGRGWNVLN